MFNLNSNLPEPGLLKTLLEPLLEDFQYWFERSRTLLETYEIDFLGKEKQAELLARVKQAQQEVRSAQMLFHAIGGEVGLETSTLMPWHQLVTECWQVGMRYRLEHPNLGNQ
ncbi:MAG: DUF2605 domain-containing protein [Cyanobacteria bacterium CRU_2_1]|nr:DUF2605 domain-containing protein [Cyanobacteria bacterium RU_5_0]NJR61566.1 DUF2605 domain-containing protein [Cyanobacteria bacterium CRU_2_1]